LVLPLHSQPTREALQPAREGSPPTSAQLGLPKRIGTWLLRQIPLFVLLCAATVHALPALLNAAGLHSDGAVVGLQAKHLLHGEWSWFLWGSGYQTVIDSVSAALLFLILGSTPLALTLSPFLGYLTLVVFAFATVRRRFEPWPSALLVAPLVVVTGPLHIYMFSPPRQAALTLIFAAIWLLDSASLGRRRALKLAAGALLAGLSGFADPYALLFLPALFLFLVLTATGAETPNRLRVLAAGLTAGIVGLIPVWLLTHTAHASHGVLRLDAGIVRHNLDLLQTCLPFLLGTTAYFSAGRPSVEVWPAPAWFRAVQLAGAGLLLIGIAFGGVGSLSRRFTPGVRRLAALGALMLPVTLLGFSLSVMVMDRLSARYLVAIVLMAPFALMPAMTALGPRRFAALLAPYLLSITVAGWLGYGGEVHGFSIVRADGRASDELALRDLLRARGISAGIADYWVAYRLTFLFDEHAIIIPRHPQLDRYAPYRARVAAQSRVAYIFDPWRSKEDLNETVAALSAPDSAFSPDAELLHAGRYSVLLLQRKLAQSRATRSD
jgi:hypothetical protein